jgi:hypothetical protein
MTDKERRYFLDERHCYVCLQVIPETQGMWWTSYHFMVCFPTCDARVRAVARDYSRSARGKRRPAYELLALLRAMRPQQERTA